MITAAETSGPPLQLPLVIKTWPSRGEMFHLGIPSVNLTLGTGKSPCLMGKLTINGHFL